MFNVLLKWLQPAGTRHSLEVDGRNRSYFVHLPQNYDASKPMPVVLALHGATGNAGLMARFSQLNQKADQAGFIVVYPNGTGTLGSLYWNAGNCCGPATPSIDDVAFLDAVLTDLCRRYAIDERRVFATGLSNGAMMAYRLGAELSHRIAAIAPVAGPMAMHDCSPTRPVSVLHFHGTQDEFTPFGGGVGRRSITRTHFLSAEASVQTWVRLNGCDSTPRIDALSQAGDEFKVTRTTYGPGREGSEVVLITITGGGHTWPGVRSPWFLLGKSAMNISANDLMWEYFQRHPRSL